MASAPSGVTAAPFFTTANVTIGWTVNGPYASQKIERQKGDGTGTITTVVDGLGGTVAGYTDTTVALDNYYQYRVSGTTSGGTTYTSGWVKTHTTPPAPTNLQAVRASGSVVLTWQNNSTSGQIGYRIVRDLPPFGSGNSSILGVTAANAQTYTDSAGAGVLGTDQIRYNLQPYFIAGASVYSPQTGTFLVLTIGAVGTAAAPTVTPSAFALNLATTALVLGINHNPVDSSAQAAGNLRYRVAGGTTWTTVSLGTSATYTINAGVLANGSDYEFQAQTAGMNGTLSSWSGSVIVSGAVNPTTTITTPADGASINTGTVTIGWSYASADARPQAGWEAKLLVGGVQVDGASGSGAALSWESGQLSNSTAYTIEVRVMNSVGLWSTVAARNFNASFPAPPAPTVVPSWDPDTGRVTLAVTNPAPGGGQAAAVSNSVYRNGALVADGLAVNTPYADLIPPLNSAVAYEVRAITAAGSPGSTALNVNTTMGGRRWIFLNGGPGFVVLARLREQASVAASPALESSLVWYEGRTLPVPYDGQGLTNTLRVQGEVRGLLGSPDDPDLIGTWEPFALLAGIPGRVWYRDVFGRSFLAKATNWTITHDSQGPEASVGYTVTEVDPL